MIDKLYNHLFVKHKDNEFVSGRVYTNTIENFWGLLKRGLLGIYHNTSRKHLQMYIDEFVFRYNTGYLNDCRRFDILLLKINIVELLKDCPKVWGWIVQYGIMQLT